MAPPSNKPPTQIEQPCEMCALPCSTFCATCKKAYYCSVDHQKKHRKQHKLDCFPARLESSPSFGGRCFVATRKIKAGELIFKDKALVSGPSGAEVYFHIICLGCYRSVKGGYKCSSCGWSVCSKTCEKIPHHANNECKIFRDAKVEPCVLKPYQYDFINFLRALLLMDHAKNVTGKTDTEEAAGQYTANWEQLLALESHTEARAKHPLSARILREATHFIKETCKLGEKFEAKLIDQVVGVWSINSFGTNAPATPNPGLNRIASRFIGEGEQIYTTYANANEGTMERREILRDHYYFSCTCKRCSSQTEFGTFFSSLKCPDCPSGFFVSENSLSFEALWVCSNTGGECSKSRNGIKYADFVKKINRIRKEINAAEMEYGAENCIEAYIALLDTYKTKVLHPNHWLVIDAEFKLMQRIVGFLSRITKEKQPEMLNRLIELAEHCLRVADVLQPGLNSYRGKILFCLVEGKLRHIMRNTEKVETSLHTEELESLKEKAEEAITILAREEGIEEKQVTMMLIQNVRTIDQTLEVISKHKIKK